MKCFSDWFDENIDSLEDDYKEYKNEQLEEGIFTPDDFIDFCESRFLSLMDDYNDRAYDEMKDER